MNEFKEKMERGNVSYGNQSEFDNDDINYWKNATIENKLQTITYLRECFYGEEATIGKVNNNIEIFKIEY